MLSAERMRAGARAGVDIDRRPEELEAPDVPHFPGLVGATAPAERDMRPKMRYLQ